MPTPTPAQEYSNSSTRVKAAEAELDIDAERVAEEGKELDAEVKEYDDWGDATNEEIEDAMRNIESGRKDCLKFRRGFI